MIFIPKKFSGALVILTFCLSAIACQKDRLIVDRIREYEERGHMAMNAYDGGWLLTLQPDGVANVNPGGDIVYRGTYLISGSKVKVNTPQNSATYAFVILSETELRENTSGTILSLK